MCYKNTQTGSNNDNKLLGYINIGEMSNSLCLGILDELNQKCECHTMDGMLRVWTCSLIKFLRLFQGYAKKINSLNNKDKQ